MPCPLTRRRSIRRPSQVAVDGTGFCASARLAFSLILKNALSISVVKTLGAIIVAAGKAVVVASAVAAAAFWMTNDSQFARGGEKELSGIALPVVVRGSLGGRVRVAPAPLTLRRCLAQLVALTAYVVASGCLGVYDLTIDAILMCYCIDTERHGAQPEYLYATASIRRAIGAGPPAEVSSAAAVKSAPPRSGGAGGTPNRCAGTLCDAGGRSVTRSAVFRSASDGDML